MANQSQVDGGHKPTGLRSDFANRLLEGTGLTACHVAHGEEFTGLATDLFYSANTAAPSTIFGGGRDKSASLRRLDGALDLVCGRGTDYTLSLLLGDGWTVDMFMGRMVRSLTGVFEQNEIDRRNLALGDAKSIARILGITANLALQRPPKEAATDKIINGMLAIIFGRDLTEKEAMAVRLHFSNTTQSPRNYLPSQTSKAVLSALRAEHEAWSSDRLDEVRIGRFGELLGTDRVAPLSMRALVRRLNSGEDGVRTSMYRHVRVFAEERFGYKSAG